MAKQIRPVFMFYPALYPMLMLNYWIRQTKIPITGILISDYDIKHKGKYLNFIELVIGLMQECGWRYTCYLLFEAKFAVPVVRIWNFFRRLFGKEIKIKTYDEIAREYGIPIHRERDFNSPSAHAFIKNVNANLIISAYNNQILKPATFKLPELGSINIHHSKLPDFRGLDGPFQAMRHGVKFGGVTIHRIDAKIDTGNIIVQKPIRIRKDDSVFSLSYRSWMHGATLLERVVQQFANGTVKETKQPRQFSFPYASFPNKKEVKEFKQKGRKLIMFRDLIRTFKS